MYYQAMTYQFHCRFPNVNKIFIYTSTYVIIIFPISAYCNLEQMNKEIVPGCWRVVNVCKGYCGSSYHKGRYDGELPVDYPPYTPCCKPTKFKKPESFGCPGTFLFFCFELPWLFAQHCHIDNLLSAIATIVKYGL